MASTMLTAPPDFLQVLAHNLRWQMLAAMAHSDYRVQELTQLLDQPKNLVSYHLKRLRLLGLVHEHRSSADARDVYYSLDLERLRELYRATGEALHPFIGDGFSENAAQQTTAEPTTARPVRVLFLCTHNRARSQMAEAITRFIAGNRVAVFSAGTAPEQIHPLALRALATLHIEASGQRSKHVDEFAGQTFDYIITLCDRAREACPAMPGNPTTLHWSFPDPAEQAGGEDERYASFLRTAIELNTRIRLLLLVMEKDRQGSPEDQANG